MSDNIVLSGVPRPKQGWFSGSIPQQMPISQALDALESGVSGFAFVAQPEIVGSAVATAVAPPKSAEIEALEATLQAVSHPQSPVDMQLEELDHELIVSALLDDVSSVMEDVRDNRLKMNDELVDLIANSFRDISAHLEHVSEHLAVEVGELGADVCDLIESRGASAEPIISLFNP